MKNIKKEARNILVSIFAVIKKDFKTLFRAKSSAFTIVIGPLIVIMLIFLAFNNASFFEVKVATYSSGYSELSNEIVTKLNSSGYIVNKVNNSSDCIEGVKMGEFNVCLFFSGDMKVANGANNNITVYVDSSRINIVDSITSNISKIVMNKSQGLSIELTNVLVNQLTLTSTTLKEKSDFITAINVNNNKIKENTNTTSLWIRLIRS